MPDSFSVEPAPAGGSSQPPPQAQRIHPPGAAADDLHTSFVEQVMEGKKGSGSFIVSELIEGVDEAERYKQICGCRWSGNMRVLILTAILFVIITLAQIAGAILSNSYALLADCVSMGVDALTYFLSAFVETRKGKSGHRELELIIPAISIGLLVFFTMQVLLEAVKNLDATDDDDDVNPWIVLAFAVWGLIFDIVSLWAFFRNAKRRGDTKFGINMLSAFLHVGADFARSTTTFIESILIIGFGFNGARTDAWATLFVGGTICCGALYGVYEWIVDLIAYCRAPTSS